MQFTWPNDNYYRGWFGQDLTPKELALKYKNYLKVKGFLHVLFYKKCLIQKL